jgi:polar amino acid transport system permease protein
LALISGELLYLLLQSAGFTVAISLVSIALGLVIGMVVSAASLSTSKAAAVPAKVFISFFRGVPLLVQLLLIYNLLPALGVNVPGVVAAIIGLSLCSAAFQAENLRGGFSSIPRGLLEAAEMMGMSPGQQFRRIRAPIAFRLTLPALVNETILTLKASSLVSVVGVVELTRRAQDLAATTFQPLQLFAAAGFLYLVINWIVAISGSFWENRWSTNHR